MPRATRSTGPQRVGWGWLVTHAVVFAVFLAGYISAWHDDGPYDPAGEPYIGTGRDWAQFVILPVGLPWSLLGLGIDDNSEPRYSIVSVAPAVVNLALHAAYRLWRSRRNTSRGAL